MARGLNVPSGRVNIDPTSPGFGRKIETYHVHWKDEDGFARGALANGTGEMFWQTINGEDGWRAEPVATSQAFTCA